MVQQHTIDIGIDLGTTNSAVAVVVDGRPFVTPNVRNHQITPSVVRIRANGGLDVGDLAYQRLGLEPDNVHSEFKRAMGDHMARYEFRDSGRLLRPAELSAEVLKVLLADVQRVHALTARAAVVTVPAAFDLAQCAATQEAARLAGLDQAPLLQEPVAASLAYGYSEDVGAGRWLVFDLGGGTFDLALVGVRDGQITVVDHEGDNFLGGKDFDWLVVEKILLPRLAREYNVSSLARGNEQRRQELAVLKTKAEEVKIALSALTEATVTVESGHTRLLDDDGVEISSDIVVTRQELEHAIAEKVERAIELSERLISRNAGTVESVLLVGGPTMMPGLRARVAERLGVEVNTSINPMTAVAEGAALYAATQPLALSMTAGPARSSAPAGTLAVDVRHAAVTEDSETAVALRVVDAGATAVEIAASDGSWRSGVIPLQSGAMVTRVPLRVRGANQFGITVVDPQGRMLPVEPDRLVVHRGLTAAAPPLSRSIGLVLREEGTGRKTVEWLLKSGSPLPARASAEFRTTLELEPGGELEIISVYLVEGEASRPDRNRIVGRIDITDRDVPRTLPAGVPVEVRVEVSASRLLKGQVFLPSIDHTFDVEVTVESEQPTTAELARAVLREQARIEAAESMLTGEEVTRLNRQAQLALAELRAMNDQDPGSNQQALSSLKQLQQALDQVDARVEVPTAIATSRKTLSEATVTLSSFGSESQQTRLRTLGTELEDAIATNDLAMIERADARIDRLRFEVLAAQPWFWKDWFDYLATGQHSWSDPSQADTLIRQGTNAVAANDLSAFKRSTLALARLVPPEEGSFANVGLRRG